MAAAPPRPPPSPPALPDELVEEILLRLPPDEPKWLLRASVVCKTWGGAVSHYGFRRRLHELHRTPPMLGFLHIWKDEGVPRFIPTTASAFSLAAPDCRFWRALDYRHGRALFFSKDPDDEELLLLLWDPITGSEEHVLVPAAFKSGRYGTPTAAVSCADDSRLVRPPGMPRGPFFLVFVFSVAKYTYETEYVTYACVYSSEADMWGELTSINRGEFDSFSYYSSVTVGRSLLYFMSDKGRILEYDFASHSLNVFNAPNNVRCNLMLAEDGGLGLIQDLDPQLKFWSREKSDGADAQWVLSRVICLENLLPDGALVENSVHVLGFAEGANVIFVTTTIGLFTIELQSQRVSNVCDDHGFYNLIPIVGFYTPMPQGEHQPLPSSSEEAGDKEGGEEEETIDQVHQLFENGVQHYGEGALEGGMTLNKYGCALLPKDSLGDVPKSAGNEEPVKHTRSKDDVDNSLTSGSNFESALSSKKDLEQRILKQQDEKERKRQHKEMKKEKKEVLPEWT